MARSRLPWWGVGVATVGAVLVAHATSLAVAPSPLAAGVAAVGACDTDGVSFLYTVDSAGAVTTVTVANLASTCAGGLLRITLTNGASAVGSGSIELPASGGWVGQYSVALSPQPASTTISAVHAAIEGP